MAASVVLSVITVSRNRQALLQRKLESLCQQSLDPGCFELLLCLNGTEDSSQAMVQATPLPFHCQLLSFERNLGVARARNACIEQAQGWLLYFSDDDCLLPADTLRQHLAFHQHTARSLAQGGVMWHSNGSSEAMQPRRIHFWNIHGMNTSVPKAEVTAIGGFPEWLQGYGHEDVLFGYLLQRAGVDLHSLPQLTIDHLGANPMRGFEAHKARSAGHNAILVSQRYPELAFRLGVHPVLLQLKRLLLFSPLAALWRRLAPGSFRYEYHYLEAALAAKRQQQADDDIC